jgi:dihydroorotate dehydrogenase (fumarate)
MNASSHGGAAKNGALPPRLDIDPPLLNSANPWATTIEDLTALYACPSTGAVTVRTCMLNGFNHDPARHQYAFFDTATSSPGAGSCNSSVNSLGYSPIALSSYLAMIKEIAASPIALPTKGFIVSVTGTPEEVAQCFVEIVKTAETVHCPLAMEINLSCPNIPGAPPPAYSPDALVAFLRPLVHLRKDPQFRHIPFGIKTPPYTHATEFQGLSKALLTIAQENEAVNGDRLCPMSFITAVNTLGSCLLLKSNATHKVEEANGTNGKDISRQDGVAAAFAPVLPDLGLGGMAGAALHPLALGNVANIRRMLDAEKDVLGHIQTIGVGGVSDINGFRRMQSVGAEFVGVGTALGIHGVAIFEDILGGLSKSPIG